MKAAKLELKGLRCLEFAQVPGLHWPLFAIIQLNGYTLTAQSLVLPSHIISPFSYHIIDILSVIYLLIVSLKVPIGSSTIVYGSKDGGASFKASDDGCRQLVLQLGDKLNLEHTLIRSQITSSGKEVEIAGPIDMGMNALTLANNFPYLCFGDVIF